MIVAKHLEKLVEDFAEVDITQRLVEMCFAKGFDVGQHLARIARKPLFTHLENRVHHLLVIAFRQAGNEVRDA